MVRRKKKVNGNSTAKTDINEIDRLVEMFIANCHEKFRLEKQESYKGFWETFHLLFLCLENCT